MARRKQPPAPPLEHPNQRFEDLLLTPTGRSSSGHKIARNTRIDRTYHETGGGYKIKLHDTVIVTADPQGILTLYTGGWRSNVTRERINRYLPSDMYLTSVRNHWMLMRRMVTADYDYETGEYVTKQEHRKVSDFYDGIQIAPLILGAMDGEGIVKPDSTTRAEKVVRLCDQKLDSTTKRKKRCNLPVVDGDQRGYRGWSHMCEYHTNLEQAINRHSRFATYETFKAGKRRLTYMREAAERFENAERDRVIREWNLAEDARIATEHAIQDTLAIQQELAS